MHPDQLAMQTEQTQAACINAAYDIADALGLADETRGLLVVEKNSAVKILRERQALADFLALVAFRLREQQRAAMDNSDSIAPAVVAVSVTTTNGKGKHGNHARAN